jgi:hypothetical protein
MKTIHPSAVQKTYSIVALALGILSFAHAQPTGSISPNASQIESAIANKDFNSANQLAARFIAETANSDVEQKADASYYFGATLFLRGDVDGDAEKALNAALENYIKTQDVIGQWKTYHLLIKLYSDHQKSLPDAWVQVSKRQSTVEPSARRLALGVSKNADGSEIYRVLCKDKKIGALNEQLQNVVDMLAKDPVHGKKIYQEQKIWETNRNRDLEMYGFGRNPHLQRLEYYLDGNSKIQNARSESVERIEFPLKDRIEALNHIARQLKISDRTMRVESAFEGFNDSGERWAYEFVDQNLQSTLSLSNDPAGLILYADDKWVVRAAELLGTVNVGSTNLKTELSFYATRTGKLAAIVSLPNRVFQVGRMENKSDNIFFVGTVTPSKYKYDDTPMTVTFVDLRKRTLERVPIVAEDYWLALNNSLEISPSAQGITIHVQPNLASKYSKSQPKSPNFKQIKIAYSENKPPDGEGDHHDENINTHIFLTKKDHAGLSYLGETSVAAKDPSLGRGQIAIGGAARGQSPKIIMAAANGRMTLWDLTNLQTKALNLDPNGVYFPHFFKDGSFSCVSGSNIVFVKNGDQKSIPIPDKNLTELISFFKTGDILQTDDQSESRAVRKMALSDSAIGYRVGDSFFTLNPAIEENFTRLNLVESINHLLKKDENNRIMDWDLMANAFVISRHDSDLYEYQIVATNDGSLRGTPWQGGAKFAFSDLTFSNFSEGWRAISFLNDSHTGGASSCIVLENKNGNGGEILVADELRENASPLAINFTDGKNLIIYGSADSITLAAVDLNNKKIEPIKIWKFASRFGKALIDAYSGHLFIPNASGFEVWNVWSSQPKKGFDLVLGDDSNYCVVLPDSKFAGSPGSENLLCISSAKGHLDGASLSPWRNRPSEVLKALGGDPSQIEVLSKVTERWLKKLGNPEKQPEPTAADIPTLALTNDVPLWAKGEQVNLQFEAKPGTAPVKDVVVRVNGVDQQRGSNSVDGKSQIERSIKLAEGQNWIEAVAIDEKGRSSNLLRFRTILQEAASPAKRFIIAMGVSKYRDSSMDLEFAAKDATDLSSAIKESTSGPSEILLLTNDQVTRDSVEKIRAFLANATENDEVVAFCAGHGVLDSNLDYVYASHEFDSANPTATGIKLDDLVDAIGSSKSLKRLLLLDTCHSGQVGEKEEMLLAQMDTDLPKGVRAVKQRGMSVKPVSGLSAEGQQRFIEEMFLLPGLHRGINIIGASGGAEFALESAQWNNGVFTATIIEALRDKKADLNGDTRISVSELRDFLAQRVSELTKGAQKPSVVASERDQDFDLIRAAYNRPAPPVDEKPAPQSETAETSENPQEGLQEFFNSWITSHQSNNPDALVAHYADQAAYCYEKGITPRAKIREGVARLMTGFPARNYTDLVIKGTEPDGNGSIKIHYSYRYAYSGKKNVRGQADVSITVQKIDGDWKITRFDEKTAKL